MRAIQEVMDLSDEQLRNTNGTDSSVADLAVLDESRSMGREDI